MMLENHRAGLRWITIILVLLTSPCQATRGQSRADAKRYYA